MSEEELNSEFASLTRRVSNKVTTRCVSEALSGPVSPTLPQESEVLVFTFHQRIPIPLSPTINMILEAIVTSRNEDGTTNISPMGPTVNADMSRFELRPFNTSTTFANLKRTRSGVLHITDDVGLIARSAIGNSDSAPNLKPAVVASCEVVANACRWYEFEVEFIDEVGPRVSLNCKTVHIERSRDFFGFNRAKHAVLEAAILATRLDFLPAEEIADQYHRLATIVTKTGGEQEKMAFELLQNFVDCGSSK